MDAETEDQKIEREKDMMDQNLFSRVESPETAARIAEQCEYYAEDCEEARLRR